MGCLLQITQKGGREDTMVRNDVLLYAGLKIVSSVNIYVMVFIRVIGFLIGFADYRSRCLMV